MNLGRENEKDPHFPVHQAARLADHEGRQAVQNSGNDKRHNTAGIMGVDV